VREYGLSLLVAAALAYSESTVKQELRQLMRLFTTHDRATVVRRARSLGFLRGGAS
jgi:DNA-binding NarL/FixJ family response regulator